MHHGSIKILVMDTLLRENVTWDSFFQWHLQAQGGNNIIIEHEVKVEEEQELEE